MPLVKDAPEKSKPFKKKVYPLWDPFGDQLPQASNSEEAIIDKEDLDGSIKFQPKVGQRGYKGDTLKITQEHTIKKGITKEPQREHKEGNTKGLQREYEFKKGTTKGTPKGLRIGPQRDYKNKSFTIAVKGTQKEHNYSHLRGWNKKIVDLIHDICRETVSKITYPLTNNAIAEMLDIPLKSIKTTMQRLKLKGYLLVSEFSDGRSGWSRYTLPEEFFNEIPLAERVHKGVTSSLLNINKGATQGATQGVTNGSSSSYLNNINNKETTTKIPDEWNFDISPFKVFGFYETQLRQLITHGETEPHVAEESLNAFLYDIEKNLVKSSGTKIGLIMGVLRKGNQYHSEAHRIELQASIELMERNAREIKELELRKKYCIWVDRLTDEQKEDISKKLKGRHQVNYRAYGLHDEAVKKEIMSNYLPEIIDIDCSM